MRSKGEILEILALGTLVGVLGRGLGLAPVPPKAEAASDFEPQRVAAGQRSFRSHCASCHGEAGRGDGPVAADLKIRPTDLTRLARGHGGVFPYDRVYRSIDGREAVRGHGPGSMPVWGLSFQSRDRDVNEEEEAREQIRDLMAYLQSIQEK